MTGSHRSHPADVADLPLPSRPPQTVDPTVDQATFAFFRGGVPAGGSGALILTPSPPTRTPSARNFPHNAVGGNVIREALDNHAQLLCPFRIPTFGLTSGWSSNYLQIHQEQLFQCSFWGFCSTLQSPWTSSRSDFEWPAHDQ